MNHKNFENPQKNAISSCTKSSKFMSCKTNHSPSASEVGSAERSEPRGVEGTRFLANRFFSKKYGKLVASSPIKKTHEWNARQLGVLPTWGFANWSLEIHQQNWSSSATQKAPLVSSPSHNSGPKF